MGWSDEYITGNEGVDNQHKMIFKMADDFREALNNAQGERVYSTLLQSLSLYTRSHFGIEERLMDEVNCPAAERNKEEHAKFIDALSRYQQRYLTKGFDRSDAYSLVDTIDNWLKDHICSIDMQLKH